MTNGQYPPSLLGHQGLQHSPATPVIRTMDMSNTNNRTMELSNSGSYQQLSNSPSPRDGNSPPGLHVPNGHGSHSSKVNIKQPNPFCHKILSRLLIFYMACPDNLPFRLAGSLSSWLSTLTLSTGATTCGDEAESAPAGNFWDLRFENLRWIAPTQPSHHLAGSPHKDPTYSVTPLTTMSVPGFPPPMGTFTTVSLISLIPLFDSPFLMRFWRHFCCRPPAKFRTSFLHWVTTTYVWPIHQYSSGSRYQNFLSLIVWLLKTPLRSKNEQLNMASNYFECCRNKEEELVSFWNYMITFF